MNNFRTIFHNFKVRFSVSDNTFELWAPQSTPRKANFESRDFRFIEIRSKNQKTYFRIFDPESKTTISKNRIVIELYNQTITPYYFRGEVEQIDIETPEFLAFMKVTLDEKPGKPDISAYITKFAKKTYEVR